MSHDFTSRVTYVCKNCKTEYSTIVEALACELQDSKEKEELTLDDLNKRGRKVKIKITGVPQGEPPIWLRERWKGCELEATQVLNALAHGLMSNDPRVVSGYEVEGRHAIEILAKQDEEAAHIWQEAIPHITHADFRLVFNTLACTEIN